jgi:hypothetical protein
MASLLIPLLIIERIDRKRKVLYWVGENKCSGVQCLMEWEKACTPKENGGLCVKNLHVQNFCPLVKPVTKLYTKTTHPGNCRPPLYHHTLLATA